MSSTWRWPMAHLPCKLMSLGVWEVITCVMMLWTCADIQRWCLQSCQESSPTLLHTAPLQSYSYTGCTLRSDEVLKCAGSYGRSRGSCVANHRHEVGSPGLVTLVLGFQQRHGLSLNLRYFIFIFGLNKSDACYIQNNTFICVIHSWEVRLERVRSLDNFTKEQESKKSCEILIESCSRSQDSGTRMVM